MPQTLQYQSLAEPVFSATVPFAPISGLNVEFSQPHQYPAAYLKRIGVRPNPSDYATIYVQGLVELVPPLPFLNVQAVISSDYRWQYQSKAEPLAPSLFATSVSIASWQIRRPEITWKAHRAASYAASFFAAEPTTLVEPTPAPDIVGQSNELPDLSGWALTGTVSFQPLTVPEVPLIDKYYVRGPELLRSPARVVQFQDRAGPIEPSLTVTTSLDMWYVLPNQPTFPEPRALEVDGPYVADEAVFTPPGFAELDTWYSRHPEPPRAKPRVTHTLPVDLAVLGAFVPTQLDQWWEPASVPKRGRPYVTHTMGQSLTEPSLLVSQALAWITPPEFPVRPRRRTAVGDTALPFFAAIPATPAPDLAQLMQPMAPRQKFNASVWSPTTFAISWDDELLPDSPATLGDVTAYAMLVGSVTAWAELVIDVDAS
jgi:hypothetical protein